MVGGNVGGNVGGKVGGNVGLGSNGEDSTGERAANVGSDDRGEIKE
jgi:hypothetical protein